MKLILAIVNDDDASNVVNALHKSGFSATKLATTGSYLKSGNSTFIIGVEDALVNTAIELISNNARKRVQVVNDPSPYVMSAMSAPLEVTVGGATVFVLDVEQFLKV